MGPDPEAVIAEYCRQHPGARSCQGSLLPPNEDSQPSQASQPSEDVVPLYSADQGRALYAYIDIGPWRQRVLLDTGASILTVTEPLADRLLAQGFAHEGVRMAFTLADGSKREGRSILIDNVTICSYVLHDVPAGVTPEGADMLLGLPLLNRIGRFTIDSANHELIFG